MNRPGPLRWLWYALGGALPSEYAGWVRYDTTSKHWRARHVVRSSVLLIPLCGVWALMPGPAWLRGCLVLMAALVAYFYSCAYMDESVEHRLAKHGFPPGTGRETRAAATAAAEADVTARYLARYRHG